MVTAGPIGDFARRQEAFDNLMGRGAGRLARVEPRRRMRKLVLGLLSDLPRENCWTIAEWAGDTALDGMQHLLGRATWDADQVRDDVRGYVVEHLHDDQAVLVVDETGDVKKGVDTVGVQRQYTGTAGRIENSQVAVYLVYAGQHVASGELHRSLDPKGPNAQVFPHEAPHVGHGRATLCNQRRVLSGADSHPPGVGVTYLAQAVKRLIPGRHDCTISGNPPVINWASTAPAASSSVMACTSAGFRGRMVIFAARPKKGRPYDCSASITDVSLPTSSRSTGLADT